MSGPPTTLAQAQERREALLDQANLQDTQKPLPSFVSARMVSIKFNRFLVRTTQRYSDIDQWLQEQRLDNTPLQRYYLADDQVTYDSLARVAHVITAVGGPSVWAPTALPHTAPSLDVAAAPEDTSTTESNAANEPLLATTLAQFDEEDWNLASESAKLKASLVKLGGHEASIFKAEGLALARAQKA
jgi:hypothetical protein